MIRSRHLLPVAAVLLLPLMAGARQTVTFAPVPITDKAVDTSQLSSIVSDLRIGKAVTGTITPDGGKLTMGELTLEFPKGAFKTKTKVSWIPVEHPQIAFGWLLQPRDAKLHQPLWLHTSKADLQFKLDKLGSYVLLPGREDPSQLHLIDLATVIPTIHPPGSDKAAEAAPQPQP